MITQPVNESRWEIGSDCQDGSNVGASTLIAGSLDADWQPFLLPFNRALFDNYDEDLKQLLAGLKSKLENEVKAVKGGEAKVEYGYKSIRLLCSTDERKSTLKRVEMELDEAEEIVSVATCTCFLTYPRSPEIPLSQISQMEVELPSMPVSIRSNYSSRIHTSKTELQKVKRSLKDAQRESQRDELLGAGGRGGGNQPFSDDPYTDDGDQRQRLLKGTETLEDGSRRLENAHRIALETEDVGADILRNLRGQREQIEHTRDTVSIEGERNSRDIG